VWTFQNPMFLYALAAGAIPLIVHLLKRRQAVIVHFSTLRFLKLAQKKSSRRMRMENLLLWLLRTLLMLLLALAFALPVIRTSSFGNLMGRSARDVAIVWDVSASMEYASGQKKTWEESREILLAILKSLQKGDRVTIFLAGEEVTPLISEPSGDLDLASAQVRAAQTRPTISRLAPAMTAACQSLEDSGHREREVYLVTDGQSLSWREFRSRENMSVQTAGTNGTDAIAAGTVPSNATPAAAMWNPAKWSDDYTFFIALVGPTKPVNTGVLDVDIAPRVLMENSAATASVRIGQFGEAADTTLTLFIDDKESGRLAVGATSAGSLSFLLPPLTRGVHRARIECQPDGYPLDNTLYFLLRVRERLPVLLAGPQDATFFVRRALNPGGDAAGGFDVLEAEPASIAVPELSKYSSVILCDAFPLPGALLLGVEQFAKSGGLVIIFPGDRAGPQDYDAATFLPARVDKVEDAGDEGMHSLLRLVQPQDPIFSSLKFPPGAVPSVSVKRNLSWKDPYPDAEVLLSTQGDRPFLQGRKFGKGRVMAFSVSGDRNWSNLPLSPYFLPFLHQMVEFGAGMTPEPLYTYLVRDIILPVGTPGFAGLKSIRAPSGAYVPVRTVRTESGETFRIEGLPGPGVYTSILAGQETPVLAVNAKRQESDLSLLADEDARSLLGVDRVLTAHDGSELMRLVDGHRVGRPMTETLLWLAALIAILELFVANRACKSGGKLTDSMSVALSGRVKAKAGS